MPRDECRDCGRFVQGGEGLVEGLCPRCAERLKPEPEPEPEPEEPEPEPEEEV